MTIKYEVITNLIGEVIKKVDLDGKESWMPTDPSNSDYQQYLASLETLEPETK